MINIEGKREIHLVYQDLRGKSIGHWTYARSDSLGATMGQERELRLAHTRARGGDCGPAAFAGAMSASNSNAILEVRRVVTSQFDQFDIFYRILMWSF